MHQPEAKPQIVTCQDGSPCTWRPLQDTSDTNGPRWLMYCDRCSATRQMRHNAKAACLAEDTGADWTDPAVGILA